MREPRAAGGVQSPNRYEDAPRVRRRRKIIRVAVLVPSTTNAYYAKNFQGASDACKAARATIRVFDGEWNVARQLDQIQDVVASGRFDALVLCSEDGWALAPAVEDAIARGLTVAALYTPIGRDPESFSAQTPGVVCTVGNRIGASGAMLAEKLAEVAGDEPDFEVAYDGADFRMPTEARKLEAFKQVISTHPNIRLVSCGEGGWLREGGLELASEAVRAHPNLRAYVTSGDQMTFGAEEALTAAGKEDVVFIGVGATVSACKAVKEGRWLGSYVHLPVTEARLATQLAIKAASGQSVPYQAIRMEETSPIGAFMDAGNVDGFTPEWDIS